ncbi:MAG TPA: S41 family peptidase [Bacteroidales bacterium]|nr:S41 family peptidase [Bacteroidales bacterium]HRX96319.1 S41 family peptidase [Bacteroidales bacterium]
MKRSRNSSIPVIVLGLIFFVFNNNSFSQEKSKEFTQAQLYDDIASLFETLETIHPDLYFYTPKDSIDVLIEQAKAKITGPMSALDFWKLMGPVVAKLGDGHTGLYFPRKSYYMYLDSSNVIFPLEVVVRDNKVFVSKNYSADSLLNPNTEILEINGMEMNFLLNEIRKYQWGERQSFIDLKTGLNFNTYLWMLYGESTNFDLRFVSSTNNQTYVKNVPGIIFDSYRRAKQKDNTEDRDFWFYQVVDQKIGVIEFNSMRRGGDFKNFLDSTFRAIQSDSISDLIIDIRKNGGGNSSLVVSLFSYFNTKPYTQATQMDVKISKQARKQFRKMIFKWYTYPLYPVTLFFNETRPILWGKKGKVVSFHEQPETHKIREPFFNGDVYLLTSPNTFSSANILAAVFKCYDMGTIIGEETGGVTIAFGDLIYFSLPNTGLPGICSYKKFYHPCGNPDNRGVIPDIEVIPNPEDLKDNRDTVLEFTIETILEKR